MRTEAEEEEDFERQQAKDYQVTYTEGPRLAFTLAITKRQYVGLCELMSRRFNETFQINQPDDMYDFRPESITEGGLCMHNFPGKRAEQYKSMRHHIHSNKDRRAIKWPYIDSQASVLADWTQAADQTLIPAKAVAETTLKAFYEAPVWTRAELELVKEVLTEYGVKCTRMPLKKRLSQPRGKYT